LSRAKWIRRLVFNALKHNSRAHYCRRETCRWCQEHSLINYSV